MSRPSASVRPLNDDDDDDGSDALTPLQNERRGGGGGGGSAPCVFATRAGGADRGREETVRFLLRLTNHEGETRTDREGQRREEC